jgi:transcriptional regulator with GAF, ATPase, and Fis domain
MSGLSTPVETADFLGPLLRTLAESLDVREIFARISEEARRIVPHEFLMLGRPDLERGVVRVVALSGELSEDPGETPIAGEFRAVQDRDVIALTAVELQADGRTLTALLHLAEDEPPQRIEYELQPLYRLLAVEKGMRSFLRVLIRLHGGVVGGLLFCTSARDGYSYALAPRARQIADCVALALAHQRLAEEEQRSADARARAARLEVRVQRLTQELEARGHRIVGRSKRWRDVLSQATKVAATEATVLLSGESGTGKEVVARLIHRASPRADGPFLALNCAALPDQLLESELFGHEKGAFTGAAAARAGRVEQAAGGVLFLDEVGEMSPAVQAKFLRVLQEREFQRLGGARTLKADIRVIAATNRDLPAAIARGQFREDLYYRLHVFEIALPALRERPEDILPLVESFLEELGAAVGRPAAGISQDAKQQLIGFRWPGNVRELRNAIERAVILCEGGLISSEHLPIAIDRAAAPAPGSGPARPTDGLNLEALEKEVVQKAVQQAGGNKSKAARLLGLTRAQLYSRLEKFGL